MNTTQTTPTSRQTASRPESTVSQAAGSIVDHVYRDSISFDEALDLHDQQRAKITNEYVALGSMRFASEKGRFCVRLSDGRTVFPDEWALKQLAGILGTGTQYPVSLMRRGGDGDSDALAYAMEHGLKNANNRRNYRLRIESGKHLRAVLSEFYAPIRSEWYIRVLRLAVPGGRLVHWRGDGSSLLGNVLVPDTIRTELDSPYAAMFSIRNCEIGKYSLQQQPSLYRGICTNGYVFFERHGKALRRRHRGNIDLGELEMEIIGNIQEQIPMATKRIDQFLETRSMRLDGSVKKVVAQLAKEFKLNRDLASAVLRAVHVERQQAPDYRNTPFEVINAVTRAAQKQENDTWLKLDELGGKLAQFNSTRWTELVSRAAELSQREVEKSFTRWSMDQAA